MSGRIQRTPSAAPWAVERRDVETEKRRMMRTRAVHFSRMAVCGGVLWALVGASCGEQDVFVHVPDMGRLGDATDDGVPPVGPRVTIAVEGREHELPLAAFPTHTSPEDTEAIGVGELFHEAIPDLSLADYTCDLVAVDGFRTSSKGVGCEPLPCATLVEAWVEWPTSDLRWPAELGLRGCYHVRALARIEMSGPAGDAL